MPSKLAYNRYTEKGCSPMCKSKGFHRRTGMTLYPIYEQEAICGSVFADVDTSAINKKNLRVQSHACKIIARLRKDLDKTKSKLMTAIDFA